MRGAIPPLLQYAFMAWCSVKTQRHFYSYLTLTCCKYIYCWMCWKDDYGWCNVWCETRWRDLFKGTRNKPIKTWGKEECIHQSGCCLKSRSSVLWRRVGWRWRQHGPLKRWYPTTTLHDVTTQKTSTWNITVVKISTLFQIILWHESNSNWVLPNTYLESYRYISLLYQTVCKT
jgi:hypothetical protein